MIGFIEGEVISERVVLTPGGVGYRVLCPQPLTPGQRVQLHVTTVVREDAITCYGFSERVDQACFEALVAVNGVGPQMALALLRDLGAAGVAAAVAAKDPAGLRRAQGVGAKVAEKILVMVKLPDEVVAAATADTPTNAATELVDTLEALGFDRSAAADAAGAAMGEDPDGDEAAWLAGALARLRAA